MRITIQHVVSSREGCSAILQKIWHASACGCVNKGLTHRFTTQISYYNRGNATQLKQRDHFAMLSDLPPTLKINEVNKMFYTDTRQCLSANKMLMFFKNIPTMLLGKIFNVFRVSFRFYHLHTLLLLYSIHPLSLPLKL